jgi:hypothetical protein
MVSDAGCGAVCGGGADSEYAKNGSIEAAHALAVQKGGSTLAHPQLGVWRGVTTVTTAVFGLS